MNVTCTNGHSQEITDPSDDGWEYSTRDVSRIETVTLGDGSTTQIQRNVPVAYERRIVWKCAAQAPTDENPAALCGAVGVITESVELPSDLDTGDTE